MTPAGSRRTLLRHLLGWVLGALMLAWLGLVAIGFRTGVHEADELTDGHLASTASLLISQRSIEFVAARDTDAPTGELKRHDYQQSMSVFVWGPQGEILSHSGDAPRPAFTREEGFATLELGAPPETWRTFARWDSPAQQRRIMVLLSIRERDDLAWDIAAQVAEPAFWLVPVVAIALGLAIRRGLRPLHALSVDVANIDIQSGRLLHIQRPHAEFHAVVNAINELIARYQTALARERDFASDLAHEMRTPLTSLALQAQALDDPLSVEERLQMQSQLAQDALRAGQVLEHLLSLARATHAELAHAADAFDVVPVAAGVLADHAQAAAVGRHELALTGDPALCVAGHEVLLEIALRNLVENALAHAPAHTEVLVEVNARERWIEVRNSLRPGVPDAHAPSAARLGLRLGLGHRVIDKIVRLHDGTFAEVPAGAAAVRAYRIAFGSTPDGA